MSRPTRGTPDGRAYLDLQNQARREKRTTQELMTLYVLERWLARLAASEHNDSFVLKGGLLLAAFDARRATSDGDLLARRAANDVDTVTALVTAIAATELPDDDGVVYLLDTATARTIRDDHEYSGVRVTMDCRVAKAAVKLSLDVNVGDPVTPAPGLVDLPSQRPGLPPVRVLGYPIETVLAEKTSTAIALGSGNTRARDYADIYALTGKHRLAFVTMRAALEATCGHRGVAIAPLSQVIGEIATVQSRPYAAFRRRQTAAFGELPADFAEVVAGVVAFADPLAGGGGGSWDPTVRKWG
jgi:hypothetical protein